MGFFESDAAEMLDVYMLETKQLLEQMSGILLAAEKNNTFTAEDIHSIFRVMHTIKSSSAMMGLMELSSLAHKLEDLFAYHREHFGCIDAAPAKLFDLLFLAADFMESELDAMEQPEYAPKSPGTVSAAVQEYLDQLVQGDAAARAETCSVQTPGDGGDMEKAQGREPGPGAKLPDTGAGEVSAIPDSLKNAGEVPATPESLKNAGEVSAIPEPLKNAGGTTVRVLFEEGCRMENIRAFMLVRQIDKLCTELKVYPEHLDKNPEAAPYIKDNGLYICFKSNDKDKVLDALKKGLFVDNCQVVAQKQELPAAPAPAETKENGEERKNEFLTVRADRLDQLQNLAGELMVHMLTLEDALEEAGLTEVREGTAHQINRLIAQVEHNVMAMRMVPVKRIFPKLQRILRDICRDQGKSAELVINCGEVEADKSVVDYLSEALMHIMRNALDHGIEMPKERVSAGKQEKGQIVLDVETTVGEIAVSVSDDGQGFDFGRILKKAGERGLLSKPEQDYDASEICELVLHPGFTTNDTVTEFSGRGVGLDVVNKLLGEAGGHLYINSEPGTGTTFTLTMPLTLSTMECIRFKVGNGRFSMPARYVFRFWDYWKQVEQIRRVGDRTYLLNDGRMVPLMDLRDVYGLGGAVPENAMIIYINNGNREGCIIADAMYEQKRIVIKPLPELFGLAFRRNTGICGFSIMGNGAICSALDMELLIARYEKEGVYGSR